MQGTNDTQAGDETMTKNEAAAKLARTQVANWIATGDQPESRRERLVAEMKRVWLRSNMKMINEMLENITIVPGAAV
jgi:hypothetical protein